MNEIIVILSLIFFSIAGLVVLYAFEFLKEKNIIEKLPYGFGLGIGLITYQMFSYSRFHIPWKLETLILPWIIIGLIVAVKRKKIIKKDFVFNFSLNLAEKILLGLILLLTVYVGFEAQLRPLSGWDGWAIWVIKGKMFYIDGFVNPQVYHILKEGYPFVVNLTISFIYLVLGGANDKVMLLLFYIFYLLVSLQFFNISRDYIGKTKALFFTFLLMSLQNMIRHGGRYEAGYADLAMGYYIFLSVSLLIEYIKLKNYKLLILLSIFLGITRLIKDEGLVFGLVIQAILVYYTILKVRNIKHFALSLIWLIPLIDWQIFKYRHNINYTLYNKVNPHWERIGSIIQEISRELISIKNWNLLWSSFILVILINCINKMRHFMIIYGIIFSQLIIYVGVFVISPYEPTIHVPNVIDRLFLHLAPLVMFAICLIFYSNHKTKKIYRQ